MQMSPKKLVLVQIGFAFRMCRKQAALKKTYDYKGREMKKMINIFLSGVLFGVIMAAAVTFALTIPGNNNQWRVEITRRGGGAWSIDKDGNFNWRWTVQPIVERPHPAIIVPKPKKVSDSSHEEL
jgi:preprotein translocase subunit YajC